LDSNLFFETEITTWKGEGDGGGKKQISTDYKNGGGGRVVWGCVVGGKGKKTQGRKGFGGWDHCKKQIQGVTIGRVKMIGAPEINQNQNPTHHRKEVSKTNRGGINGERSIRGGQAKKRKIPGGTRENGTKTVGESSSGNLGERFEPGGNHAKIPRQKAIVHAKTKKTPPFKVEVDEKKRGTLIKEATKRSENTRQKKKNSAPM